MARWKDQEAQREHLRRIGSNGGNATVAKYGEFYMSGIGAKGFDSTARRYGAAEAFAKMRGKDGTKRARRFGKDQPGRSFDSVPF